MRPAIAARNEWKDASSLKTFDEAVEAVALAYKYAAHTSELATLVFPGQALRRQIASRVVKTPVLFD